VAAVIDTWLSVVGAVGVFLGGASFWYTRRQANLAAAASPPVAWRLEPAGSDWCQLVNVGTTTAEGMTFRHCLSSPEDADVPSQDVQSGARVTFLVARYVNMPEPAITVTWGSPGERRTWYSHLPG